MANFLFVQGDIVPSGTWNAQLNITSNDQHLSDYFLPTDAIYAVAVAGTTPLGDVTSWNVGDYAYCNGKFWTKLLNLAEGGGGGGAQNLVITSNDSTVIQNGVSSYNPLNQTITANLSANIGEVAVTSIVNNDGSILINNTNPQIPAISNVFASQAEVNAGIIVNKSVNPNRLANWSTIQTIQGNLLNAQHFKGAWNAGTNIPNLTNGVGTIGDMYLVSSPGSQTFGGASSIDFCLNAIVGYNGSVWQNWGITQIDNNTLTLTPSKIAQVNLNNIVDNTTINVVGNKLHAIQGGGNLDVVHVTSMDNSIIVNSQTIVNGVETLDLSAINAGTPGVTSISNVDGSINIDITNPHVPIISDVFASQLEVNTGLITNKSINPNTLTNWSVIQNLQSQLSDLTHFRGYWNASTNTPHLANGIGSLGDIYLVSVPGSQNFGGANLIPFCVGSLVGYDGASWSNWAVTELDNNTLILGTGNVAQVNLDNIVDGTTIIVQNDKLVAVGGGSGTLTDVNVLSADNSIIVNSKSIVDGVETLNLSAVAGVTDVDNTDGSIFVDQTNPHEPVVSTVFASQAEVDAGIIVNKSVNPNTLGNWSAITSIEADLVNVQHFRGFWNASTNTPHLANGIGTIGDIFLVSASGSQNFGGATLIAFAENALCGYDGVAWSNWGQAQIDGNSIILGAGNVLQVGLNNIVDNTTINVVGNKLHVIQGGGNLDLVNVTSMDNSIIVNSQTIVNGVETLDLSAINGGTPGVTSISNVDGTININNSNPHIPVISANYATQGQVNTGTATNIAVSPSTLTNWSVIQDLESQLSHVTHFRGFWNASTNTPTLVNGTGSLGDIYLVSVPGDQNFGGLEMIPFCLDALVGYDGASWSNWAVTQIDNSTLTLTNTNVVQVDLDNIADNNTIVVQNNRLVAVGAGGGLTDVNVISSDNSIIVNSKSIVDGVETLNLSAVGSAGITQLTSPNHTINIGGTISSKTIDQNIDANTIVASISGVTSVNTPNIVDGSTITSVTNKAKVNTVNIIDNSSITLNGSSKAQLGNVKLSIASTDQTIVQNGLSTYTPSTNTLAVNASANVGLTYNTVGQLLWNQEGLLPSIDNWAVVSSGNNNVIALPNGSSNKGAYSIDGGRNWIQSITTGIKNWIDAEYINGVFVAIAQNDNDSMYSIDSGVTWIAGGNLPSAANWISLTTSGNKLIAIANGTNITAVSINSGITWTSAANLPVSLSWTAVTSNGNTLVAVASSSNQTAYSINNGLSWLAGNVPSVANWNSIKYADGYFVAVASGSTASCFSTDGINWTAGGALPSIANWTGLAYGNGVWIAVATNSNKAAFSLNHGQTWAASTLLDTKLWYQSTYINGNFVSVSGGASGVSLYAIYVTEPRVNNLPGNNQTMTWNDYNNLIHSSTSPTLLNVIQAGWIPVDTSGASLAINVIYATYTKIGSLVYIAAQIVYPSTANTNSASIGGLPIPVASGQFIPISVTSNATAANVHAQANASGISFIVQTTAFTTVKNNQLSGVILNIAGVYSI